MASHRKAEKRSEIPCACGCGQYPARGTYWPGHWYRVAGHLRTGAQQGEFRGGGEASLDYDAIAVFTPKRRSPEQSLMEALLQQVLTHYGRREACLSRRRCLRCEEDLQWVTSEDSHYLYSFESVCSYLGIEASKLRTQYCQATLGLYSRQHAHQGRPPMIR